MQDKIIILKNTKIGIVKDTIMSVQDTLRLDLKQEFLLPDSATIKTIAEPLTGIEYWGLWIAAIGGLVGIIAAIKAFKDLFKRDESQQLQIQGQQDQINELVKLNKLFEKRVRMTVKPHLWSNGSGYNGTDYTIHIKLDNRGEMAFYSGFETLEGEGDFTFEEWDQDIPIKKDGYIQLSGNTSGHPNQTYFKIKVFYYDKEDYKYETIIEWNNARVRFLETNEL
ncbi:hypothetical protein HSX10_05075 [Winogradskyella undariae]|uniref:hypothetical protein n=1 Tax=Winogradskyella undariae TaxID=1285465 RepID=UPI00156B0726|nr:hypothetical protein [Winogradskyella undariae]NRR90930.1 hypothetical protein [Winogradskyella undariae]